MLSASRAASLAARPRTRTVTLSRVAVQPAEARLGSRLCERGRGTFRLTDEGNAVLLASRKLFAALEEYDVWFTALRRDQSPSRANLQHVEPFRLPSGKMIQRVSPLAEWTAKDVWGYAKQHGIRLLPLYDLGYTSIGCEPCTSLPLDPSNPRSGRWQGQKLECGIHVQSK